MAPSVSFTAFSGVPEVRPGDDLPALIATALDATGLAPEPYDVFVVAQKIVSKAEGRFVDLAAVTPSARARELAAATDKDPRVVEVVLAESEEVLRHKPGVIVVAHRLGYVMANAGIDRSNLGPDGEGEGERVLLLPADPDASAETLRQALEARYEMSLGVIVSDSFGRAWRNGVVDVALGVAGLSALVDVRGRKDRDGRTLNVTETGFADAVAAGAALAMGEADEGTPVVVVRGLRWSAPHTTAQALIRPKAEDMFR